MKSEVLIRNRLRCKKCDSIIESKSAHDANFCACRSVMIDGGMDYPHIVGDPARYELMMEYLIDGKKIVLVDDILE